jgi:hypothetical protein
MSPAPWVLAIKNDHAVRSLKPTRIPIQRRHLRLKSLYSRKALTLCPAPASKFSQSLWSQTRRPCSRNP